MVTTAKTKGAEATMLLPAWANLPSKQAVSALTTVQCIHAYPATHSCFCHCLCTRQIWKVTLCTCQPYLSFMKSMTFSFVYREYSHDYNNHDCIPVNSMSQFVWEIDNREVIKGLYCNRILHGRITDLASQVHTPQQLYFLIITG